MFILHKILPLLVLPLGWLSLLMLYAIVTRKRWPIVVALALMCIVSAPITSHFLTWTLESRYEPVAIDKVELSDAIVVLGGYFGPAAAPGFLPNLNEACERLEGGIVLWQQRRAEWLVFTGAQLPWERVISEGERAKGVAISRGVPAEQVLVTRPVSTTADESLAVANLIRERRWRKVILITTAWHMPRATRLFRKVGVNVVAFPVDYEAGPIPTWNLLSFLPRAESFGITETILHEWLGLAYYSLLGR